MGSWLLAAAALAAGALGCAATADGKDLARSVGLYNEGVRWKRFAQAALFLPPEERSAFVRRYVKAEDRLQIESLEVRGVTPVAGSQVPAYDVTVLATVYLLPSTVVERLVLTQRWELAETGWRLMRSDRELLPAAAP